MAKNVELSLSLYWAYVPSFLLFTDKMEREPRKKNKCEIQKDYVAHQKEKLGQEIYNANEAKRKRESRLRLQHTDYEQVNAAKRAATAHRNRQYHLCLKQRNNTAKGIQWSPELDDQHVPSTPGIDHPVPDIKVVASPAIDWEPILIRFLVIFKDVLIK